MPKFPVKENLRYGGKRYRPGSEIELDATTETRTITRLLKLGVIASPGAYGDQADDPNDPDFLSFVLASHVEQLRNATKHPRAHMRPLQLAAIEAEIARRESATNEQPATNTSGDGSAPAAGDSTNVADAAGVGGEPQAETERPDVTAVASTGTVSIDAESPASAPAAKSKPAKNKGGKS